MTLQATRPTPPAKPVAKTAPVAPAKPTAPTAPVAKAAPAPVAPLPAPEVPPEPVETNGKREFANAVRLTVHLGQPQMKYTADGRAWTTVRSFVSMGKNSDGEYKPSLWLTIKAFTTRDGDASLPEALNGFEKGNLATVSGRLQYEEYQTQEGETRGTLVLIADAIEN